MINKPTHQVTIVISSHEDESDVNMRVSWSPLLGDDELNSMGYKPAAYALAERFLFTVEDMINMSQLLEIEEGDLDTNRSIN